VLLFSGHHFDKFPFFAKGDDISMHASALWNNSSNALVNLLDAPYWNRVWIIQEVVLAPKAKIYYGKHILPFSFANNAQVILTHHYYGCCARWGVNANGSQWTIWTQLVEKMISIGHIRELKNTSALSSRNDSGKLKRRKRCLATCDSCSRPFPGCNGSSNFAWCLTGSARFDYGYGSAG
jgi:hypothetical protein